MRRWNRTDYKRKGIAIVLTALMLTIIIPMVGLAVDAAMMFSIRAKIQAAADAASMASARALSKGLTIEQQVAAAQARATAYFNANFPTGSMNTLGTAEIPTPTVEEVGYRTRRVTVSVTVTPPSYFMRYLNWGPTGKAMKVKVSGQTSRRDVNVSMVVDRSGSLSTAGACDELEAASIKFVEQFANKRDKLGLITYGGSYRIDYPMTLNFMDSPSLTTELGKIYPGGCNGWTGSAQALWNGYQALLAQNEPGVLNAILLFTDGQPNTITADWKTKMSSTTEVSGTSRCYDWVNSKFSTQVGWDPSTQVYRGFIAGDGSNRDGVRSHSAPAMPVTDDPGYITKPVGFSGADKPSAQDCYWRSDGANVHKDVPYYPNTDYWGNSVFGYKSISTYTSGHPYAGKVKITSLTTQKNAAINALADASSRILADNTYKPVIYAIGLGGVGEAEEELLLRVSNDKDSPIYTTAKREGLYVYASDSGQLNQAFVTIASEILRYNK